MYEYDYDVMSGQNIINILDSYGIDGIGIEDFEALKNNPDAVHWSVKEKGMFREQELNEKLSKILGDVKFDHRFDQDGLGKINHLNFILKQEGLNIRVIDFINYKGLQTVQEFIIILGDEM